MIRLLVRSSATIFWMYFPWLPTLLALASDGSGSASRRVRRVVVVGRRPLVLLVLVLLELLEVSALP